MKASLFAALTSIVFLATAKAEDSLPSWNEGPVKKAIVGFVAKVTKEGSPDFVPVTERIAAFDNDGTLWAEQPTFIQKLFALDRVKALAPHHPEWKDQEPFASLFKGDLKRLIAGGEEATVEIAAVTHTGMTTPMLEFLAYLRTNGFKTFIVSGRGVEFLDGKGVWHPARTGPRQQLQDEVRDARWQVGARPVAGVRRHLREERKTSEHQRSYRSSTNRSFRQFAASITFAVIAGLAVVTRFQASARSTEHEPCRTAQPSVSIIVPDLSVARRGHTVLLPMDAPVPEVPAASIQRLRRCNLTVA